VNDRRRYRLTLAACLALATALFVLDLATPLGVAGGLPYLTVVLVGLLARMPRTLLVLAALATVLIALGFHLSPPGALARSVSLLNYALAVSAIWAVAIVSFVHLRSLARLQPLADRDALTGLYNRHYFDREAQRQISAWRRYGQPLSLLMLDIDHFKRINDKYGHPAGDAVLKALAEILTAHTRDLDTACRYGGEEFVVLLPFTDVDGALAKAEQIRGAIAALTVPWQRHKLTFRVSMGVVELRHADWELGQLIAAADKAMYQAKSEGRDRICVAAQPAHPKGTSK
jgi:diguanylate cyclase (GGDEF)-like protein